MNLFLKDKKKCNNIQSATKPIRYIIQAAENHIIYYIVRNMYLCVLMYVYRLFIILCCILRTKWYTYIIMSICSTYICLHIAFKILFFYSQRTGPPNHVHKREPIQLYLIKYLFHTGTNSVTPNPLPVCLYNIVLIILYYIYI
jgi:hypothetical protein